MKRTKFGEHNGQEVYLYELENCNGMKLKATNFGAILTSLMVPDRAGKLEDVVLGYDTLKEYVEDGCYFGATVGPYPGRIDNFTFDMDGKTFTLENNNNGSCLHGGYSSFCKQVWSTQYFEETNTLKFIYFKPDMRGGFPGDVLATATYTLEEDNSVRIEYEGLSDKRTPFSMMNHSYFNLSGHKSGTIDDHILYIRSDYVTPTDFEKFIATGEYLPVKGTAMDFNKPKAIGKDIANFGNPSIEFCNGYDIVFVISKSDRKMERAAILEDPKSGRVMEVFSDQPCMNLYTSNFLDNNSGKDGAVYQLHQAVCLEMQDYLNAVNLLEFPSPYLEAGETYSKKTVYHFYNK